MATNDLADLNSKLATALRDTAYETWATGEVDAIVIMAVDQLWPRFSRPLDAESTTITLADDDLYYSLPSGVVAVSRIDLIDADGSNMGPVPGRSWELTGDPLSGTAKLHISGTFARTGYTLELHGYGKYDTSSNLIPSDFAPLVLARARAEALRRIAANRERFKAWLARNQTQNVTVNELLEMINEADAEANRLTAQTPRTWQKPVSAYTG